MTTIRIEITLTESGKTTSAGLEGELPTVPVENLQAATNQIRDGMEMGLQQMAAHMADVPTVVPMPKGQRRSARAAGARP